MLFSTLHPFKFWLLYPYWWYFDYKKEYTFEEAEKVYLEYRKKSSGYIPSKEPTNFLDGLKAEKQDGDKLYFYRSPTRNWFKLAGAEKFILVRENGNGIPIASFKIVGN